MKVKETFCSYTDFSEEDAQKMNEEISELKNELEKTRNMVRFQRLRYQQLVSLFSVKLQEREEEARSDLQAKHIQLTRILRSLYVLESKLRKEQRVLKTTLSERDALIVSQQTEITELKSQLEKIVECCVCAQRSAASELLQKAEPSASPVDNKPDLISYISIAAPKSPINLSHADNPTQTSFHQEGSINRLASEGSTVVIPSLDDYDVNSTMLHVKEPTFIESSATQNDYVETDISKKSTCITDETSHCGEVLSPHPNITHEVDATSQLADSKDTIDDLIHHIKEPGGLLQDSPRQILKEVTENSDKLNGPVLKCVKQILSQDTTNHHHADKPNKPSVASKVAVLAHMNGRCHPAKPPKPLIKPEVVAAETITISSKFLSTTNGGSSLTVKPLPKLNGCDETSLTSLDNQPEEQQWATDTSLESNEEEVLNGGIFKSKRSSDPTSDESKIVQTVSALLSDSADSDEEEGSVEISPTVSQMVKKFEGMRSRKNTSDAKRSNKVMQISSSQPDPLVFQTNFEEFHLVDKEIESTYEYVAKDSAVRLEAEGEENKAMATIVETSMCPTNAKYETFLEVTGLSQKSILTPSRILSNHRNVIKPKDVKYRNRVKAATLNDKCNCEIGVASPIMKYWTEPYL